MIVFLLVCSYLEDLGKDFIRSAPPAVESWLVRGAYFITGLRFVLYALGDLNWRNKHGFTFFIEWTGRSFRIKTAVYTALHLLERTGFFWQSPDARNRDFAFRTAGIAVLQLARLFFF